MLVFMTGRHNLFIYRPPNTHTVLLSSINISNNLYILKIFFLSKSTYTQICVFPYIRVYHFLKPFVDRRPYIQAWSPVSRTSKFIYNQSLMPETSLNKLLYHKCKCPHNKLDLVSHFTFVCS